MSKYSTNLNWSVFEKFRPDYREKESPCCSEYDLFCEGLEVCTKKESPPFRRYDHQWYCNACKVVTNIGYRADVDKWKSICEGCKYTFLDKDTEQKKIYKIVLREMQPDSNRVDLDTEWRVWREVDRRCPKILQKYGFAPRPRF